MSWSGGQRKLAYNYKFQQIIQNCNLVLNLNCASTELQNCLNILPWFLFLTNETFPNLIFSQHFPRNQTNQFQNISVQFFKRVRTFASDFYAIDRLFSKFKCAPSHDIFLRFLLFMFMQLTYLKENFFNLNFLNIYFFSKFKCNYLTFYHLFAPSQNIHIWFYCLCNVFTTNSSIMWIIFSKFKCIFSKISSFLPVFAPRIFSLSQTCKLRFQHVSGRGVL